MTAVAAATLLVVLGLTVWAVARTGPQTRAELALAWRTGPWPRQIVVDFYGLEIILALWMIQHAGAHETWGLLVPCLVTMPVLGASSAAAYWLLAVGSG